MAKSLPFPPVKGLLRSALGFSVGKRFSVRFSARRPDNLRCICIFAQVTVANAAKVLLGGSLLIAVSFFRVHSFIVIFKSEVLATVNMKIARTWMQHVPAQHSYVCIKLHGVT
jgi:hypothetical protein